MVTKIRMAKMAGRVMVLYLNPNDFSDDEVTHRLQRETADQQYVSDWVGKQWLDETPVQGKQRGHDQGRHAHQEHHGQPALRGVYPHLPKDLEALANDIGKVVEDLCQVAAGLALQHDGGDEEFNVDQGHALREVG